VIVQDIREWTRGFGWVGWRSKCGNCGGLSKWATVRGVGKGLVGMCAVRKEVGIWGDERGGSVGVG
jgi:hypothetical protein